MNYSKFATLVRYYTKTNSTTFSDADILTLANIFKDDIAGLISKEVGEDYFGLRFERDLIAGQREYDLPAELMTRIKYLNAKLDGTNWERLKETDLSTYGQAMDEATIEAQYADKDPEFDIWDNSIYILSGRPIIDVTDGLRLWAIVFQAIFPILQAQRICPLTRTITRTVSHASFTNFLPGAYQSLISQAKTAPFRCRKRNSFTKRI